MTPSEAAIIANELRYLTQRFDEHAQATAEDLAEIKTDVKRTNGRVTAIETDRAVEHAARAAREAASKSFFAWTAHPVVAAVLGSAVSVGAAALLLH